MPCSNGDGEVDPLRAGTPEELPEAQAACQRTQWVRVIYILVQTRYIERVSETDSADPDRRSRQVPTRPKDIGISVPPDVI